VSLWQQKLYTAYIAMHIIHAAYIGWAKKQGHCVCPHLQNAWTNLKVFWHTTTSLFLNTSIKSIRQSGTNPRHLATKLTPGFSLTKWSEVTRVHCPCLLNNSKICIILAYFNAVLFWKCLLSLLSSVVLHKVAPFVERQQLVFRLVKQQQLSSSWHGRPWSQ